MSREPETSPQPKEQANERRRDRYEYLVLGVSALAFMAAAFSGVFTMQQACISQDQAYRSLRAYLVVVPEVDGAFTTDDRPTVTLAVQAKGQTPVYRLRLFANAGIAPFSELAGANHELRMACQTGAISRNVGTTFADQVQYEFKVGEEDVRVNRERYGGTGVLIAYGTACYEDIFSRTHTLRFCYEWNATENKRQICEGRTFAQPLGEEFEPLNSCGVWYNLGLLANRVQSWFGGDEAP